MKNNETFVKVISKEFENIYKQGCKDTAEKFLIRVKQLVEKWLSKDDEKVGFIFDFEEFIKNNSVLK